MNYLVFAIFHTYLNIFTQEQNYNEKLCKFWNLNFFCLLFWQKCLILISFLAMTYLLNYLEQKKTKLLSFIIKRSELMKKEVENWYQSCFLKLQRSLWGRSDALCIYFNFDLLMPTFCSLNKITYLILMNEWLHY